MKPLPTQYSKNSYNFKLVNRTDDVCIYEQREPSNNRLLGYEVFEVVKQQAGTLPNGKMVEEKEVTPSNSEWGRSGFTVRTIQDAEKKQVDLLAAIQKRVEKRENSQTDTSA